MSNFFINNEIEKIKEHRPLIHCITNYVTANDCANIVLALGGIPTMANLVDEVSEITPKADALVINIGTLSKDSAESMIIAGKAANKNNVPVVFDPVGAAASEARKKSALKILSEVKVSVVKGNIAEIKAILGMDSICKGVDSLEELSEEEAKEVVKEAALRIGAVVAITGKRDYISDGEKVYIVSNGHKILTRVTGTGCMTTSLIATYLGTTKDELTSTVLGIASMGIAGEIAYKNLKDREGSGTLRVKIIDEIYNMTSEDLKERGKINE
ncbi:hydroxyethylthiazole kinase [Clostridium sp. DSM 8431]|uniref:hydroxyethylthiazole kinase n=1 Tax=Clostridium sp. DSM 8431 TaxID=1761781 RepID=UPI0008EEB2D6|nr:hydroxyethylthiazole kinase [Clostridium sp. DSM 8431]SFU50628.1 hydroxyethylthiazole kinase [Clostridium sp. DSM 8431]